MAYAVVGYFDEVSEGRVREIWARLASEGVCGYLHASANRPHVKFAMYTGVELWAALGEVAALAGWGARFGVHFKSYGIFPGERPVVFLGLAPSEGVLAFQRRVREGVGRYGVEAPVRYFEPGIWAPDCQLTVEIPRERLRAAVDVVAGFGLPFDGELAAVGVIEFHPAREVATYPLGVLSRESRDALASDARAVPPSRPR